MLRGRAQIFFCKSFLSALQSISIYHCLWCILSATMMLALHRHIRASQVATVGQLLCMCGGERVGISIYSPAWDELRWGTIDPRIGCPGDNVSQDRLSWGPEKKKGGGGGGGTIYTATPALCCTRMQQRIVFAVWHCRDQVTHTTELSRSTNSFTRGRDR